MLHFCVSFWVVQLLTVLGCHSSAPLIYLSVRVVCVMWAEVCVCVCVCVVCAHTTHTHLHTHTHVCVHACGVCVFVWGWGLMLHLTHCIQAQHKYSEWTLHTVLHSPCVLISSLQSAALRLNTVDCVEHFLCCVICRIAHSHVRPWFEEVPTGVCYSVCSTLMYVWWCCFCYCCSMYGFLLQDC